MKQRTLGRDGLAVSALGLGCMGLSQGYGAADDTESITTVHRAIEAGITFLDTAMSYGIGHNERLLGRALAGRREKVTLATKFGIVRGADGVQLDGRPDHVHRYCDASLARLGVDTIDLYYLHRIDPQVPVAETVGAMAELIDAAVDLPLSTDDLARLEATAGRGAWSGDRHSFAAYGTARTPSA